MTQKQTAKEQIQKILEDNGGKTADKATNILLHDPALKELKPELEFISKNWRDPLRPAMIKLACEAVGGKPQDTEEVAMAMSLMNLSFYLWDDIIDKAPSRLFKPTMFGKFGEAPTLIMGGLASAKAFTLLSRAEFEKTKREKITELFWNMWTKMAEGETASLKTRGKRYSAKDKLQKIETEAANFETCLKIGAIMGNGSEKKINCLGKYGLCLGVILELHHDCQVSLNLTLELADKIRSGAYPYTLLWAREQSEELQKNIMDITSNKKFGPKGIETIVKSVLATKALDEIYHITKELTEKAVEELEGTKKNRASRALRFFAQAQPLLFRESLPVAQV
jgi:geranylgeranyl pyrophosphate synthase